MPKWKWAKSAVTGSILGLRLFYPDNHLDKNNTITFQFRMYRIIPQHFGHMTRFCGCGGHFVVYSFNSNLTFMFSLELWYDYNNYY